MRRRTASEEPVTPHRGDESSPRTPTLCRLRPAHSRALAVRLEWRADAPVLVPSLRSRLPRSLFRQRRARRHRRRSIEDLLAESGGSVSGRGRARVRGGGDGTGIHVPTRKTKGGRLARQSPEQIAKAVDQVVALVKKSKTGLRSEEIKKALSLDVREVPRILKTGVKTKKLKAKGQKRATVYSVR